MMTSYLNNRFIKITGSLAVLLTTLLVVQIYFFVSQETVRSDTVYEVSMRVLEGEWKWSPDVIEVVAGTTVRLSIYNEDSFAHGFAISELGVDQYIPANRETTFEFIPQEPGEYEFFCSVLCGAGHFQQKGKIIVLDSESDFSESVQETTDLPIRDMSDAVESLSYDLVDGVKVFQLTAEHILWDYGDGKLVESWGYNGVLPGPEIRVTEGDRVRVEFTNNLPVPTSIHWHGVDLEWSQDGVPGLTQGAIEPGESFVYEFTAEPAGTRFYHSHGSHHSDEARQIEMGLAGPFIIEPEDYSPPDIDYTLFLTERISSGIFPMNGGVYPNIPPLVVGEGDTVLIRMINPGPSTFHPMHLHGHQFKVVAVDGNPVPEGVQLTRNTQNIVPGETYDIEFEATNPGSWLLHCHELQHAGGGMVMEVVYEGFDN